jgi:uroporphyrinogen III methyltransferase/synthase
MSLDEPTSVKVFLVGAGPGDPKLITIRGWQILQRADVVLYDGLVNEELLTFAPEACQHICVGKRGHGGSWKQSEINDLLVKSAREFQCVVRLKGGDTGVFARTAEEVERLEAEGIPYEIVPGITAALAVSAYTGIPITHRDWSSCVALVTGQGQATDGYQESEEPMDWEALARFPGTLVLYMGVATAPEWSRSLIAAGKPPSTPVALIRNCSCPDQEVVRCELGTIEETLQSHRNLTPPIITVIGEVVHAAPTHHWFDHQPLRGKRFAITSPVEPAYRLQHTLEPYGAHTIIASVISIEHPESLDSLDQAIDAISETDWIVFSSVNGVRHFFGRLRERNLDARALSKAKVAAVGSVTAQSMERFGIQCDLAPRDEQGAEALWKEMRPLAVGKRVTVVRAPEGKTWLLDRLRESAANVRECVAYRQQKIQDWPQHIRDQLKKHPDMMMVVTSSNHAEHAVHLLGPAAAARCWLSLSDAITETLNHLGCHNVITSRIATYPGLVDTALRAFGVAKEEGHTGKGEMGRLA